MTVAPARTLVAINTATDSENRMHADDVAAEYGFAGGLVPGVAVYAYLTHVPAERWGAEWLRRGTMSARFVKPVYDGEEVGVFVIGDEGATTLDLELRNADGEVCATGRAGWRAAAIDELDADPALVEAIAFAELPASRPPASAEAFVKGAVLGSISAGFHASEANAYLDGIRETLPVYTADSLAHPGWMLWFANKILMQNVVLGPWIHVGSDVQFLDVARDGERIECRGQVIDEYERGGHRFVILDVALTADARPLQRITHTAIYQPRKGPKDAG